MFNICINCGADRPDKQIDVKGPYAICPECSYKQVFKQLPLFVLTGASGAGKSSVCVELSQITTEVIPLEGDLFWSDEFNTPETDYREFREFCLRVSKNISQGGKPVVLCGSAIPSQYEGCIERRYFSDIYYMGLVCNEETIAHRLKHRPAYRNCGSEEFIKQHISFNNWFKQNHDKTHPCIKLFDSSLLSAKETANEIADWIYNQLKANKSV